MNVPNIATSPGSVTALPRAAGDGDTVSPRGESVASGRSIAASSRGTGDFARLAWFDVNGDGHIDPRSAAAGGDATLLVPHAVDLPVYSRNVSPSASSRTFRAPQANTAQTNRAVDAYQRYGQTPATPTAPTTVPANPAVHLAAPPVPAPAPPIPDTLVTAERAVA